MKWILIDKHIFTLEHCIHFQVSQTYMDEVGVLQERHHTVCQCSQLCIPFDDVMINSHDQAAQLNSRMTCQKSSRPKRSSFAFGAVNT